MKLTKWLVGLLMVMSLMFAVGCSKKEESGGGGIDHQSINRTYQGDFAPWDAANDDFDWGNEVSATAVITGANKVVFSGGITGEGKISGLRQEAFEGAQFLYGVFEINGNVGDFMFAPGGYISLSAEGWGDFEAEF